MPATSLSHIAAVIDAKEQQILQEWLAALRQSASLESGRIKESELNTQAKAFFTQLRAALRDSGSDVSGGGYDNLKAFLADVSRSRAIKGFSPSETAMFVFSLKQPLFTAAAGDADSLQRLWEINKLIDEIGLYTMESYQKSREEVIVRQQREISELSTPVVKLWEGVLALPLIGTLDSARTQVVMENLLQSIVDYGAEIAVIDITGVPTVDTLVAQHLLKTVAAARLMGADCIISGIRPQIAQTMVHLGVDLDVTTKASLADAFAVALRRMGRTVVEASQATDAKRLALSDHMDRIPILKMGDALLITIQVDMHDRLAMALEDDLTQKIVQTRAKGVLIDISALEIVDSFIGRMLDNIAAVSRILDAETVVVGMRPAVAITLVELGLSLTGVKTALNVERGMALIGRQVASARGDSDRNGR